MLDSKITHPTSLHNLTQCQSSRKQHPTQHQHHFQIRPPVSNAKATPVINTHNTTTTYSTARGASSRQKQT